MSIPSTLSRRRVEEQKSPVAGLYARLKRIMKERNLKPKHLSLAAGLGETGVRDMFTAKKAPRIDTVLKIAGQLGISLAELVEGDRTAARRVPIIGCASAGEGWAHFAGDGPIDEILLEIEVGEAVGVDVRGDSMKPVYRDRDILIGTKHYGPDARSLIGLDCIIETVPGDRYIKFIAKGSMRGRYNLKSYNPAHDDIRDVEIGWAAPITLVVRTLR